MNVPLEDVTFLVTIIVINFIPLRPYLDSETISFRSRTDRSEMVGLRSGSNLEEMVSPGHLRKPERLE
jgi:hypothetical protein